MAITKISDNPLFRKAEDDLTSLVSQLKAIKHSFTPENYSQDKVAEYKDIQKRIIPVFVRLLELGADYNDNTSSKVITIVTAEGDAHNLTYDEIHAFMGDDFYTVFPDKKPDSVKDEKIENEIEELADEDDAEVPMTEEDRTEVSAISIPEEIRMSGDPTTNFFASMVQAFTTSGIIEDVNKKRPITEDLKHIGDKILGIQSENDQLKQAYGTLEENYNAVSAAYSAAKEENDGLTSQLSDIKASVLALNEQLKSVEESIEDKNKVIEDKDREIAELTEKLDKTVENDREELAKKDAQIEEIKADRDSKVESLTNELESLKASNGDKLNESQKNLNRANNTVNEQKNRIRNLENAKSELTAKVEELEKKNAKLAKDYAEKELSLQEQIASKNKEINELSSRALYAEEVSKSESNKVRQLEELAYRDSLTGCHNANAFNKDFAEANNDEVVLAYIGIHGVRNFNEAFGLNAGNACISKVSENLVQKFGDTVYRLGGDEFAVIFTSGNKADIEDAIIELQNTLKEEEIEIYFGVAAGKDEFDLQGTFAKARDDVKAQKTSASAVSKDDSKDKKTKKVAKFKAASVPEEISEEQLLAEALEL